MSEKTFYYAHSLGNAVVVGIGSYEIAKFWYDDPSEEQCNSPVTREEAEELAQRFIDNYLLKEHPIDSEMEETYGDSESRLKQIKLMNKIAKGEDLSSDERAEAMVEMLSAMGSCCCED